MGMFKVFRLVVITITLAVLATVATAQQRGPVTNLPIPRFVSLKANEANVRRGPSLTHRIDWVFKRRAMPLKVIGEYEHWRRVQDQDGAGGWVHYALLSGARTVIVLPQLLEVYRLPNPETEPMAAFEMGVVARLEACTVDWCEIEAAGHSGWARKTDLWGVFPTEIWED